jgi:hypothetical protein
MRPRKTRKPRNAAGESSHGGSLFWRRRGSIDCLASPRDSRNPRIMAAAGSRWGSGIAKPFPAKRAHLSLTSSIFRDANSVQVTAGYAAKSRAFGNFRPKSNPLWGGNS